MGGFWGIRTEKALSCVIFIAGRLCGALRRCKQKPGDDWRLTTGLLSLNLAAARNDRRVGRVFETHQPAPWGSNTRPTLPSPPFLPKRPSPLPTHLFPYP